MTSQAAFTRLKETISLPSAAGEYDRFALYCTELQEWNRRMNLTAITDDEGVAEKHFADSLLPLTMVALPAGASLVDVGSGAGFPGLPMALARPDLRVTFLDSLQKRLTFLAQLTQKLEVPARMLHARAGCRAGPAVPGAVRYCHGTGWRQFEYACRILPAAGEGGRPVSRIKGRSWGSGACRRRRGHHQAGR